MSIQFEQIKKLAKFSLDLSFVALSSIISIVVFVYVFFGLFVSGNFDLIVFSMSVFMLSILLIFAGSRLRSTYFSEIHTLFFTTPVFVQKVGIGVSAISVSFYILAMLNQFIFPVHTFDTILAPYQIVEILSKNFLILMIGLFVCTFPIAYIIAENSLFQTTLKKNISDIKKSAVVIMLVSFFMILLLAQMIHKISPDSVYLQYSLSILFGGSLFLENFSILFPIKTIFANRTINQ